MAIVGFNFTKISAERKQDAVKGKIDIKNNVSIMGVEESDLGFGNESQKAAKITFDFNVNYEPKFGSMKFSGDVLFLGEAKKVDNMLEEWKKSKKLPQDMAAGIINTILTRSNIQALILSQQVNLPAPIQLPKVKVEGAPKKEE